MLAVNNAAQKMTETMDEADGMFQTRRAELMDTDKDVRQLKAEYDQCQASLDKFVLVLDDPALDSDSDQYKKTMAKIQISERKLNRINSTMLELRKEKGAGEDNLMRERINLGIAAAQIVRAGVAVQKEVREGYKQASAEKNEREQEILSIVDAHVKITLMVWFTLLADKYYSYLFRDWLTTSGLGTMVGMLSGYALLGGPVIAQAIAGSGETIKSIGDKHSFILLTCLFVLHFVITTIIGYRRRYMDGLNTIVLMLTGYVFAFEKFFMKELCGRKIAGLSVEIIKHFGGACVAFLMCGCVFLIHQRSGSCMLPPLRADSNIVYAGTGCYPSTVVKPGQACSVECKPGHTNLGKLKSCGWFTSCARTTYECVEDTSGAHFKYGEDEMLSECYPKEFDPLSGSSFLAVNYQ